MVSYKLWGKDVDLDLPKETFPTDAEIKAMEDIMPGCEHGWFEGTTGAQLHYRKFVPTKRTKLKGIVVFNHGIQTHSGKSFVLKSGRKVGTALMSAEFTKAGYALYALDMLGHGYSEGTRHFVPSWETNRADLDAFGKYVATQNVDSAVPLFLLGHSYGSTLSLHVAESWQTDATAPKSFEGIVILAPAIVGDVPPFPVTWTLRYLLAPLAPKWTPFFMPNPVSPERVWSDKEVLGLHMEERYREMGIDGSGKPFRLGTAVALLTSLEVLRKKVIPNLKVPFCVVHGTEDAAVPVAGTDLLEAKASTPKEDQTIHRIKAYHDLLCEPGPIAEQSAKYAVDFMNERVSKA